MNAIECLGYQVLGKCGSEDILRSTYPVLPGIVRSYPLILPTHCHSRLPPMAAPTPDGRDRLTSWKIPSSALEQISCIGPAPLLQRLNSPPSRYSLPCVLLSFQRRYLAKGTLVKVFLRHKSSTLLGTYGAQNILVGTDTYLLRTAL